MVRVSSCARAGRNLFFASDLLQPIRSSWIAIWPSAGFRILGGVVVGAASVVCPMYITEIAPARRRGFLVAVSQLNIVVGILAAYFSNYLVAHFVGADDPHAWRWMFGVMILRALFFFITTAMIPESPRWLVKSGRKDEARQALLRFAQGKLK
ncbi:MAG TPA: MFS transporter [Verrucomicrobiae bacterium]|nr:MFS transporter [Verrucomicrobiae bacterium]